MKSSMICILLLLFLTGCKGKTVYRNFHEIEDHLWLENQPVVFEPEWNLKGKSGFMRLFFRHATGYPFEYLDITVKAEKPGGVSMEEIYHFELTDSEGNWLGDGAGDLWDINFPVLEQFSFDEMGKYRITITQRMNGPLPLLLSVGLKVYRN